MPTRSSPGSSRRPRARAATSSTWTQASGRSGRKRTASTSATACGSRRTTSLAGFDVTEHATRVVVLEDAVRVDSLADALERVPFRVALLKLRRGQVVALAPVRAPAVARHDRFD